MPKMKIRGVYKGNKTIELKKNIDISVGDEVEVDIYRIYEGKYPLIADQVAVYLARTEIEAGFVIEALAEGGIESQMYSQRDRMVVTTIGDLSLVRVIVAPKDVHHAERIIAQLIKDGRLGAAEDVSIVEDDEYEPHEEI